MNLIVELIWGVAPLRHFSSNHPFAGARAVRYSFFSCVEKGCCFHR
jgi:hypothetical protein